MSSTAHLLIGERLFELDSARFGLSFTVSVHLGTALAVLMYFARTWIGLVRDVFAGRWRLGLLIGVGTIPAVVAGTALEPLIEREFRDLRVVVAALVAASVVFVLAERYGRQDRAEGTISLRDALLMGTAQAIALVPGVSRSGITISSGLGIGLRRADATRFSFLLSTPVILGAGAKRLLDVESAALLERPDLVLVGFLVSFAAGFAAVAFLMRFLRTHSLNWFVAYRLALAALLVAGLASGVLVP